MATVPVPTLGSKVTAGYAPGQSGLAVFDPNTGKPLAGAGAYNPNTGARIASPTPTISSANATSPTVATTPVVTSANAEANYIAKYTAFRTLQDQISAQADAKARAALQAQADQAQKDLATTETNLKQQGLDIQKVQADAQKAAADAKVKAANAVTTQTPETSAPSTTTTPPPPPGWDAQTYANFKAANPTLEPTAEDTAMMKGATQPTSTNVGNLISSEAGALSDIQAQRQTVFDDFKSQVSQIMNGTFPLSATESSLVNATLASFERQKTDQAQANLAYEGTVREATFRAGGEYTPMIASGILANAISTGITKIANLDALAAKTVADLEQSFMTKDYKIVNDLYDRLDKQLSDKSDTVKSIFDATIKNETDLRNYNLDVQKFITTTAQTERQISDKEKMDAFDRAYKTEDLAIKRANSALGIDENGNPARPVVAVDSTGKPVAADQEAFLAKLPPATATMVKSLTDYSMNPANISLRSNQRQQILALAHQYDPTFNEANYAVAAKVKQEYTSGTTAKNIQALNTSVNHLGDLAETFKNLPNTNITKFNTIKDWYSINVGKGDVTKVMTDLNAIAGELAKTFKGTGATDQEISAIEKGINLNSSPAQFKAFIEESTKLLGGRLNALNDAYQTSVGKPFDRSFLGADTQNKLSQLKNNGFDIEVPGVLYTDPKAYVKYDPQGAGNLKAVIAAYPNLSQSDALQLAQSLNQ